MSDLPETVRGVATKRYEDGVDFELEEPLEFEGYQLGPVVFAWTLPKRRGVKSMTTMITGVELDELLTGGEVGTVEEARATTARIYLRARELRNTNQ